MYKLGRCILKAVTNAEKLFCVRIIITKTARIAPFSNFTPRYVPVDWCYVVTNHCRITLLPGSLVLERAGSHFSISIYTVYMYILSVQWETFVMKDMILRCDSICLKFMFLFFFNYWLDYWVLFGKNWNLIFLQVWIYRKYPWKKNKNTLLTYATRTRKHRKSYADVYIILTESELSDSTHHGKCKPYIYGLRIC